MREKMFRTRQGCMAVCAAVFCLASVLGAQAQQGAEQQWKTYKYASDGFSISFPSAPTPDKQNIKTETGTFELRTYLVEDGSVALYVGVCDYGSVAAGSNPDKVLQGAKNGAIGNVQGHILSEGKISLGTYPGLTFEAENKDLHFSARLYYVGTILYQTLLARGINEPYSNAETFLNSFQLIARPRP